MFRYFLTGLVSILAQILLMRELLSIFYGNELTVGVILGSWLLWNGAGSYIAGKFNPKSILPWSSQFFVFSGISLLSLPFFIFGLLKLFNFLPGTILSPMVILTVSFLISGLMSFILGFLFTVNCMHSLQNRNQNLKLIGRVYVLEAFGAGVGGLLFNFFFVERLNSSELALGISFLLFYYGILLSPMAKGTNKKKRFLIYGLIFIFLCGIYLLVGAPYHQLIVKHKWSNGEPLYDTESRYGKINLIRYGSQITLYENGFIYYSVPDELKAEEAVHYALLQHPDPKKVLLIGGGPGGELGEILKHNPKSVDYIELDPLIIKASEKFLPEEYKEKLKDKRVRFLPGDARFLLKSFSSDYDVIIMNLPDPYNALINRLYTLEFFEMIKSRLNEDGIFSFSISSSDDFIGKELAALLKSLKLTLKKSFKEVLLFPGNKCIYFATNKRGILTESPDLLIKRLNERHIDTKFVREYFLYYRLNPMRFEFLKQSLAKVNNVPLNTDFHPISYLFDMILWNALFFPKEREYINFLTSLKIGHFIIFICFLMLPFLLYSLLRTDFLKTPLKYSVFTVGFTEICLEITTIIAFQTIYGYVYSRVGIIMAMFMVGLGAGGHIFSNIGERFKKPYHFLTLLQAIIMLYCLISVFIISYFLQIHSPLLTEMLFLSFILLAGFLGGCHYPIALSALKKCYPSPSEHSPMSSYAGMLYGVDLFGSALGAILISTLAIPLLGLNQTFISLSIISGSGLLFLIFALFISKN